jgi:phosphatidylinositol phospholipase C delta
MFTEQITVPVPDNREKLNIYIQAELLHPSGNKESSTGHHHCTIDNDLANVNFEPEVLEFKYDAEELAFVRLLVRRPVGLGKDEKLAVFCARVDRLYSGWRVVRLMDMKGKNSGASLLMRIKLLDESRN